MGAGSSETSSASGTSSSSSKKENYIIVVDERKIKVCTVLHICMYIHQINELCVCYAHNLCI